MRAILYIGAAGIPKGFKLCKDEAIQHPVDGMWGGLIQNELTGVYMHLAAGALRTIDQGKAKKMDTEGSK